MLPELIIDTDAGHDDILAIILLVKSKLFSIKAITTVAGNSSIRNVTRNVFYVLNLLHESNIPIYSGFPSPLKRRLIKAVIHGKNGLSGADTSKTKYHLTKDAPEQLIKIVKNSPRKVTILTLGPLSNIARVLQKDHSIATSIDKIVMMGGSLNGYGNKSRVAEFNMFVDPEAADIVFKSPIQKILLPLDACNECAFSLKSFTQLPTSVLNTAITQMMREYISKIKIRTGIEGTLVYDALAAYYLISPTVFTTRLMDIVIEKRGKYTSGMTVAERRFSVVKKNNVSVIEKVEYEKFKSYFFALLKS
ncbi:MAG: nucleoside hydrolase [Patescibacteria group bacterium]|jgi:inosine-uridine nucleoside N-ribohydrolase